MHCLFMSKHYHQIKNRLFADITAIPGCLQSPYYRPLDGVRGIAIILVLLSHIGINHYLKPLNLYIEPRVGVHLFFVLSGFLITTLLIKEKLQTGNISIRHFYIRRALRIMPVAYLFLLIVIVLNHYYRLDIPLSDFLASFFFLKNFPIKNEPLTAHFWSLAVEEQFYLTFPLLLAANIKKYFFTALSIIIIIPLIAIFGYYHLIDAHHPVVKVAMYIFWKGPVMILIGSVFSILLFRNMIGPLSTGKYNPFGFILFFIAVIIRNTNFIGYMPYLSEYLSVLILAYTVSISVTNNGLLSAILKSKVLVHTGIISYSIYIWQELFIGTRAWEPWLYPLSNLPLYLVMLIKLSLIFIIALVSYYLIEKTFLKFRKRFK